MAPYGVGALARRAYIQRRLLGATVAEATATLAYDYGYIPAAMVAEVVQAGELALGTAARANRQRIGYELRYAAFAGVELPAVVTARVLITYRLGTGELVHNSQLWHIGAHTTLEDLRYNAQQWIADRYPSAGGAAQMVDVEYQAVIYQ